MPAQASPAEQDRPASVPPPPPAPKQPFTLPPIVKTIAIVAAVLVGLAALSMVAYFALAKTDEQCRREASCEQAGLCTATFQSCIAATSGDCAKAQNCREFGECTARDGKCVVASERDCSEICKTSDRCVARDGRCICDPSRSVSCLEVGKCGVDDKGWCTSFTVDGCRKSSKCAQEGLCALAPDKAKCIAKEEADCLSSQACKKDGRCVVRAGTCVRLDCAASEECTVKGRCSVEGGACKAAKDADCAGAEWCKKLGRCKARDGVCRASTEGCKASEKCKDEGACFVSPDGEACVTEKDQEG